MDMEIKNSEVYCKMLNSQTKQSLTSVLDTN